MNIKEIKTRINETSHLLLEKYDAIGISIGLKEKGGEFTDEIAVVFHVKSKKDISELSPEKVIPQLLTHSGIDIITDVNESASFNTLSILDEDLDVEQSVIDSQEIDMGLMFDLNPKNSKSITLNSSTTQNLKPAAVDYWNDLESDTITTHRSKHRPLSGGISSIYHRGSAATLGLIVSDASDGSTVLLSNNHVYAGSQFAGTGAITNGSYGNPLPLSTIQPSRNDDGNETTDIVGKFKRVVPLTMIGSNYVDAAISTVQNVTLDNKVLHFNQNGPYEFATTTEIDSLLDVNSSNFKAPVFRSGRTLGPIGYPGNEIVQTANRPVNGYANLTDITGIANIETALIKRGSRQTQRDTSLVVDHSNLIVKTTNKDYYVGGLLNDTSGIETPNSLTGRKFVPNNLDSNFTGDSLIQVGNFDYLNIGSNLTLGISANEIVYYTNIENENTLFFTTAQAYTNAGSLPIRIPKAQGDQFVKLQMPIDLDTTFSDKNKVFTLSTNRASKPVFGGVPIRATTMGQFSGMGELSGSYYKVSDDLYMRKPEYDDDISIGLESFNNMPYFSRRGDGTWTLYWISSYAGGRLQAKIGTSTFHGYEAKFNAGHLTGLLDDNLVLSAINIDQTAIDAPIPLQDLSGIKKITNGQHANLAMGQLWFLSGSDIFTLGSNGNRSTVGTGTHGFQHNLRTKLPGEWNDIHDFGISTVLALSTSGDIFFSTPPAMEVNDIYRVYPKTYTSNSNDLTANNMSVSLLGGKKFKKIFSNNSYYWFYGIDENDDLYWVNVWYQGCYRVYKNNTTTDKWDANITECHNPHGNSANHFFSEGNDMYFVNINGMTQRRQKDARDNSQTTFLFDQVNDRAGIAGRTATKMSGNYLSGSGTAFGWRTGGDFYDIDNFCGYDTTTNTWRVVGENTDNSFSDEETFSDDVIVTDVGANVRVNGFGATSEGVIFKDCLGIRSKHGHFPVTAGGDSGSAVFAKFGNTWKVIGLVFAGPTPTNTARGIVCRIDRIQEQLNIKPWDGIGYSDTTSTQLLDYTTNKLAPVDITLSGRKYSSIGVESFF